MDNYSHRDENIVYILENIPGRADDTSDHKTLLDEYNSQLSSYCECKDLCNFNCACITMSGTVNYILQEDNFYRIKTAKLDTEILYPVFECNSLCKCSNQCGNRIVQHGPMDALFIKTCRQGKGFGLFTSKPIPMGTFLCEYAGEIITKNQAIQRQQFNLKTGKMNYIFCLNEHCNENITRTIIDPSQFGNIGRYINHSCEPNAQIIPVRVDSPIPKLAIFACKYISPGTEITFDYGPHGLDFGISISDGEKKKCLCGSQTCREWMPFDRF